MKRLPGLAAAVALSLTLIALAGCAHEEKGPAFRPLQIEWISESAEADQNPNKDGCVIRLTADLMGEAVVQASAVEEIGYRVKYHVSSENGEILEFTGACADISRKDAPECAWTATCDSDLKLVVKFHNGH